MSFCPNCGKGHGNGGDPCAKCEAREVHLEALTLDARKQFNSTTVQQRTCAACEKLKFCLIETGEPLCEECFVKTYVEMET